MGPVRIGLLAISGWLVAAVLTVGASWSAINVVRDSVVQRTAVSDALPAPEETGSTTAAPTTARPSPSPAVAIRSLSGQGGSVTAQCTNGVPAIVKAAPRQGFRVDVDDSGREVQFRSSDHRTQITVTCSGGTPRLAREEKAISAGGGDDNGGGGGDGDNGGGGGDDNGGGGGGGGGDN
jgi:uncharacterized membrane protein YgcG